MRRLPCRFVNLLLAGEFGLIKVACKVLAFLQRLELFRIDMGALLLRFILLLRRIGNVTWGTTREYSTEAEYEYCPLYLLLHAVTSFSGLQCQCLCSQQIVYRWRRHRT